MPLRPLLARTPLQEKKVPVATRVAAQRAAARRIVRAAATELGVMLGPLRKTSAGAPLPSEGWHWSLSHTSDYVGAVLAREAVGIDVERIQERREDLRARVLSPEEEERLSDRGALGFTRAWTAKEAVLKRAGVGLRELSKCRWLEEESDERVWLEHQGTRLLVRQRRIGEHVVAVSLAADEWEVDWSAIDALAAEANESDATAKERRDA